MRLDYAAVKDYIRAECATIGLGVVFHEEGTIPGPYTDAKNLHLFEPQGMWTDEQWDMWKYEMEHEIGHEAPENSSPHWKEVMEKYEVGGGSLLGSLFNLVSDHVQEHNRVGKYSGRDRTLKRGRALFTDQRLISTESVTTQAETREGAIFKVVALYDAYCRESWNEWLRGSTLHAVKALEGDEAVKWEKLYKSGIKIQDGKNEEESYQIAKQLLNAMGEDAEEEERKAQQQYKQAKSGGSQPGEGKEGEGSDGEGGGEGDGLSEKAKEEIKARSFHTHYQKVEDQKDSYNTSGTGSHIDYYTVEYGTRLTPKEGTIVDMKSGKYGGLHVLTSTVEQYKHEIDDVHGGEMLASKVKRLFTSMKQVQWEHGQKRGRISGKNLWKAKGPIYSDEVFRRKQVKLDMDTAITVLCDFSGSMSGYKYAHAAKAALMLNEAVVKIGAPVELLGFSENHDGPINVIMKSFGEIRVSEGELKQRYAIAANWMGQNSDGESIAWAYGRLKQRQEKRKVLIVLSDGSPASWNGDYGAEVVYTREVVKHIEENTPVEIYGVGIMDENVKHFYKEYKVINSGEELEDMLLGLVKTKIMGS